MEPVSINERIINHNRAVLIAPAGCGKTETIVDSVAICKTGRQLVLTHTNAGVDSLNRRLKKKGVSTSKYKLQTIASFAEEYVHAFPHISNAPKREEEKYYEQVYKGAVKVLNTSFAKTILEASYAGVFVDEYQDCNLIQHEIIKVLANVLPCRILGDPLQGIFDFGGNELVDWDRDIYPFFDYLGELSEPWRWKKSNLDLGNWIMETRIKLEKDEPIDFTNLPDSVVWVHNDANNENQKKCCFAAKRRGKGSCVAIHKFSNKAHSLARQLGGLFYSDEEVEGKDLIKICEAIGKSDGQQRAIKMYEFAGWCATGVKQGLNTIIKKVEKNDYNMKRIIKYSDIANDLLNIIRVASDEKCYEFLCSIEKQSEFKIFRKELWCEFKRVLKYRINHESLSLLDIARLFRSTNSLNIKYNYENIVSRVLLIKGLEYDQAIVLDADELTKKEFYVAISRPKQKLVILSKNRILSF